MSEHIFKSRESIKRSGFKQKEYSDYQKITSEIPAHVGFSRIKPWEAAALRRSRSKSNDKTEDTGIQSIFD